MDGIEPFLGHSEPPRMNAEEPAMRKDEDPKRLQHDVVDNQAPQKQVPDR